VATDTACGIGDETACVKDIVRDCLLNTQARDVSGQDLEWAITTLVLYLAPTRFWEHRWGETVTFDDFARHLLERPVGHYACIGTHKLSALAVVLQVHERCSIVAPGIAEELREECRRLSGVLCQTQQRDGSWTEAWAGVRMIRTPAPWMTLHATGHLVEAEMLLPADCRVPGECLERAGAYLAREFARATESTVASLYCPYSHAAHALCQLG